MRIIDLKIEDVAFGGKGLGRHDGKAVFVPYTIDGETITAEIVRGKKQFAEAELVEVRERSPHRVSPECQYFGRCGGCTYQHIDYSHQLEVKWRQVRDVLRRIGKITDPPMRPIIPSPEAYGYRNRITVHVIDGVIGFFRRESNRLIDIEHCPIASDELNRDLQELRKSNPLEGHYTLRAENNPRIFNQTNDAVAERLREIVIGFVSGNQQLLIDAYCGSGFFAKSLLDKFDKVIGIDWDRFAIEEARKDATEKETYIAGNAEEALQQTRNGGLPTPKAFGVQNPHSLAIIVDPPATGLTNNTRSEILELEPDTLIYVSCDPATLARDLKELGQKFSIESVTPLDMFPQTAEIEVAAHLTRSGR